MRVVQLAAYSGPYSGSFVPMLRAALQEASAQGWDACAVLSQAVADAHFPWVEEIAGLGVPITYLDPGSRRALTASIAELIAPAGPTVLHTHFTGFDIGAVLAARRTRTASVLWHVHSPQKRELAVLARNVVKYALLGRATFRMLCVAPDIASDVRRRGAPARKVRFFPNAIDTQRFRPPDGDERAAARAELGLPASVPVLLHFGWDWQRKGGDLFLKLLAVLRGRVPTVVGVSAGGGDQARALADRLGVADVVRVIEPATDARPLYAAADVFVSSSRAEGMPFAVAEALCSGLAVVATDLPGHRAVAGGVAACRIGSFDPRRMADDARALLGRSAETVEADSQQARQSIVDRLDLDAWAKRLADLHAEAARNA
jgi:glycosyltransferase involved in cell wall biosynthesis